MSVPNQKVLIITKPRTTSPPFLQVSERDWQEAYRLLSPSAFGIYLYLAQNAADYQFEYSPSAIERTGLMSKGTATKARQELENKGYIEGNRFYVQSPQTRAMVASVDNEIQNMTGK